MNRRGLLGAGLTIALGVRDAVAASIGGSGISNAVARGGQSPLPPIQTGVYYVRAADGSLTGDGQTVPWLTVAQASAAPAGSTVYFWGGDDFTCAPGTSLIADNKKLLSFGTGLATIIANYSGYGAVTTAGNSTITLRVRGDGGNTWHGIHVFDLADSVVIDGCDAGGFYAPTLTDAGADIFIAGRFSNLRITNNIIGGAAVSSPDDNGIWVNFAGGMQTASSDPTAPALRLTITGNLIKNIGSAANKSLSVQTGNGAHLNGITDTNSPSRMIFDANGEPINHIVYCADNVIQDCGANCNVCGGPSAILVNADRAFFARNKYIRIRPVPYAGGCDFAGLDFDIGATNCWSRFDYGEDVFGPAFMHWINGSTWGPNYFQAGLAVNCGNQDEGALCINGNGNSGNGAAVMHGITVVGTPQSMFGSAAVLALPGCAGINGLVANCAVIGSYNSFTVHSPNGIGPGLLLTNNAYSPYGPWFQNGATQYNGYATWKSAGGGSDQHGTDAYPPFVGGYNPPFASGGTAAYKLLPGSGAPYIGGGFDVTAAPWNVTLPKVDFFGGTIAVPYNIGADGATR